MTSREQFEKELRNLRVKTAHQQTDWGYLLSEGDISAILAAVDAHVERVVGEDEKPVTVDGFYFPANEVNKAVQIVNNRLAIQRQRAGLEVKHGA